MGVLEISAGFVGSLRPSRVWPRLEIAARGSARSCTKEHLGVSWVGPGVPEPAPVARHLDISLEFLTKGRERVALVELERIRAAGQDLREGSELGAYQFRALTLVPGEPFVDSWFSVQAPEGEELRAQPGDEVEIRFRLGRNSRPLPVRLRILEKSRPSV